MQILIILGIIILAYYVLKTPKEPSIPAPTPPIPPRDDFVPLPPIFPTPPPPVPISVGGGPGSLGYHWDATFQLWIGPTSVTPSYTRAQKPEWDGYIPAVKTIPIIRHVAIS